MTFAAPWALWGLLLLVGPVLVHLLSRRTATRRMFPTLRFLETARLQPVSRRTLDDRALLALRLLIVALAVLAWARPQRGEPSRDGARKAIDNAMVLLLDTSASMQRPSSNGTTAVVAARRLADSAAVGIARVLRVETNDPAAAMHAAAEWLHERGGGALVLFTDAQRGALLHTDVSALPRSVRLLVRSLPVQGDVVRGLGRDSVTGLGEALNVYTAARLHDSSSLIVTVDSATVHATLVVALADIAEHPLLREVLARHPISKASRAPDRVPGWITVPSASNAGAAVLGWIRPSRPVVLQLAIDESHPAAQALVAVTRETLRDVDDIPLRERDTDVLDAAQLTALERTAVERASATRAPFASNGADSGMLTRWLWMLVLLALSGEWWLRTRMAREVVNA